MSRLLRGNCYCRKDRPHRAAAHHGLLQCWSSHASCAKLRPHGIARDAAEAAFASPSRASNGIWHKVWIKPAGQPPKDEITTMAVRAEEDCMSDGKADVAAVAQRHGSARAPVASFTSARSGGGRQAQFSHPELGGMGQWSGGMTQIGDMFNDALKAKVSAFCQEMSAHAPGARAAQNVYEGGRRRRPGRCAARTAGGPRARPTHVVRGAEQHELRLLPGQAPARLSRDGRVTVYDTGEHRLTGFSQQQPGTGDFAFAGQSGPVALHELRSSGVTDGATRQ